MYQVDHALFLGGIVIEKKARAPKRVAGVSRGFREGKRKAREHPACSAQPSTLHLSGPGSAVPRAHAREHAFFPAGERRGRGDEIVRYFVVLKTRTKP